MSRAAPADSENAEVASSQVERCYRRVRSALIECEIKPGERFTERELLARMEFGRTPLREALLRLANEGLVEALPRSGYRATALTEKTVNDLYDVWQLVGPLIVRLAFSRMTPEIRDQLRRLDKEEPSTVDERLNKAARIFDLLVMAADNEDLAYINRRLSANMRRVFTVFLDSDLGVEWMAHAGEWEEMANTTDPDAAAARIADFVRRSHRGVLEVLRRTLAVGDQPPVRRGPPAQRGEAAAQTPVRARARPGATATRK